MAQGVALSVYSQLGSREWADEAYRTVVDMQRPDGWLPEYPVGPDVLNGHIFATLGLYDYLLLTGIGKPETLRAVQAVADRMAEWRRVRRVSRYGGSYPAYGQYHDLHVMLLERLGELTGAECFAEAAQAWDADAP